jgi:hypothetical protein
MQQRPPSDRRALFDLVRKTYEAALAAQWAHFWPSLQSAHILASVPLVQAPPHEPQHDPWSLQSVQSPHFWPPVHPTRHAAIRAAQVNIARFMRTLRSLRCNAMRIKSLDDPNGVVHCAHRGVDGQPRKPSDLCAQMQKNPLSGAGFRTCTCEAVLSFAVKPAG